LPYIVLILVSFIVIFPLVNLYLVFRRIDPLLGVPRILLLMIVGLIVYMMRVRSDEGLEITINDININ